MLNAILYIIAAPLFLISVAAHIYVKFRFRPKDDSELEDYYHEFEDKNPALAEYLKFSRITFTAIIISMLLLFLAIAI